MKFCIVPLAFLAAAVISSAAGERAEIRRVTLEKDKAVIEGQFGADFSPLVLWFGDEKSGWADAQKAGPFKAVVELSDRIKLEGGGFGRGFVFRVNGSQTNVPLPKEQRLEFRAPDKIVQKDGVFTFADVKHEDGSSLPMSVRIRKKS